MRTKLFILTAALLLLCSGSVFAQANYNINIGGLPISSGSAVPGSCPVDGALFFKNVATESWSACIGGTYTAFGTGGGLPAHLTYADPTLTVSAATFGNGQLALSGNTSGTATITAPAVAGTVTNALAFSNGISLPAGTTAAPSMGFETGTGFRGNGGGAACFAAGGNCIWTAFNNVFRFQSGLVLGFTNSIDSILGTTRGVFAGWNRRH
jgi:hypothetical protein